jgi:hypothetical protein
MTITKMALLFSIALAYADPSIATPILGDDLAQFSVFAGVGGVTNTPTEYAYADDHTMLSHNLGTTNTTASGITGFWGAMQYIGPGIVTGYTTPGQLAGNANIHQADGMAASAYIQLTLAQQMLEAMRTSSTIEYGDLSGMTLAPGVYSLSAPAFNLAVGATLTLDGAGYVNPRWVFLATSQIVMETNSSVVLINADAGAGVYWDAVSSVTLDVGATMIGNVLAKTSITMLADANISCGRALDGSLAGGGNVTLSSNVITSGNCAGTAFGLDGRLVIVSTEPISSDTTEATPLPEPSGCAMLLMGLGVMGATLRRRVTIRKDGA